MYSEELPMRKMILLVILVLSPSALAVSITGARGADNGWDLRFAYIPKTEKIGAFKVTIRFLDNIDISSVTTDAPADGAWSQIKPEMVRSGNVLEVAGVGPAMLNSKIDDTLEMFHLSFSSAGALQSLSLFKDIIDTVWVSECFDIRGSELMPLMTTNMVANRLGQPSARRSTPVKYNGIGRVHSFSFNLAGQEMVRAWVVDASGRVITKLVDKKMDPGMHTLRWPGSSQQVAAGIYFIQLEIQNYTYNKKVSYYR